MVPTGPRTTVASAPGKVLVAGGYLVLDPAYPGLVISTDSRFYSHATSTHDPNARAAAATGSQDAGYNYLISVRSPQFVDALWQYRVGVRPDDQGERFWVLEQTRVSRQKAGANPFVSLALLYTVRVASEVIGLDALQDLLASASPNGIEIVVVGDNDFYSQRESLSLAPSETPTISALESLPPFAPQSCRIGDVHKTGLGSSAAMTTSLVGCLLTHLGGIERDGAQLTTRSLALVHNLAQLAHCAAQGKVGSGFDVSAAVWGSQLYRRFDPAVLKGCLEEGDKVGVEGDAAPSSASGTRRLKLLDVLDPLNPLWRPSPLSSVSASGAASSFPTAVEGLSASDPHTVPQPAPLSLPPHVGLVLADVDAGSNTPSLVSKVLAWRAAKPEWARQLYAVLASSNAALADHFLNLRMMYDADPEVYDAAVQKAAATLAGEWDAMLKSLPVDASARGGKEDGHNQDKDEDEGEGEEVEVTPYTVLASLIEVRNTLRSIRAGMRELGTRSGAPVEPREMGRLIKRVAEVVPGVIGGGVPGAGGYDALFLLHLVRPEGVREEPRLLVERFWKDVKREEQEESERAEAEAKRPDEVALNVGPLLSRAGAARQSLASRGEAQGSASDELGGFRIEDADSVGGLKQAIGQVASS